MVDDFQFLHVILIVQLKIAQVIVVVQHLKMIAVYVMVIMLVKVVA